MAPVCLDNAVIWNPPVAEAVAEGTEYASPLKQRHGHYSSPLPDPPALPTDEEYDCPLPICGQTRDQPIYIPPDVESDESDIDTDISDAGQDDGEQSDSTLPSINALVKRQDRTSRRGSLDSLFEDPDSMRRPASPAFDHSSQEICPDIESLPWSSPPTPGVPSIPQADDEARSYETRSKISPGSEGPDRTRGITSASSTRPETPKAGSPTPTSPSRPRRRGIGMEIGTACGSEAASPQDAVGPPHDGRSNLPRTSQRRVKTIGAYVDSDSDSDDETSARRHAKVHDDEEFHLPLLDEGGERASGGVDDTDDELDSPSPKRRRASRSPASSSRKRRRGIPSLGVDVSDARAGPSQSACNIPSPPSSRRSSQDGLDSTTGAKFEEWSLPNATLKRITLGDGRATFQLQFDWDPHVDDQGADCPSSNRSQTSISRKSSRRKQDAAPRVAFTPQEDTLLIELKEGTDDLSWPAIYRQFNQTFPERRSKGSLQVHYSTKLKRRGAS